MECLIKIVDDPGLEIRERTVLLGRIPILGEYVCVDDEWFEIKRVVHQAGERQPAATLFSVTSVDPTDEPLRLSEWMEPAP